MIFFCCFFHRHFSSPSHFNGVVTKGIVSSNRLLFLRIRINTQTLKEIHNTYSSTLILLAKFYGLKKPNMYFIMKMITKPIVLTYNFWTQYMAIYPWTEDSKNNSTELSSKVLWVRNSQLLFVYSTTELICSLPGTYCVSNWNCSYFFYYLFAHMELGKIDHKLLYSTVIIMLQLMASQRIVKVEVVQKQSKIKQFSPTNCFFNHHRHM